MRDVQITADDDFRLLCKLAHTKIDLSKMGHLLVLLDRSCFSAVEIGAHDGDLLATVSEICLNPPTLAVERVSAGSDANFFHRKLAQYGHPRSAKCLGRGVSHCVVLKRRAGQDFGQLLGSGPHLLKADDVSLSGSEPLEPSTSLSGANSVHICGHDSHRSHSGRILRLSRRES